MRRKAEAKGRTLWVAAAAVLTATLPALAQTVPTGVQEYFVLGYEQHTWDMMDKVENGEGGGPLASGMNSVVTGAASADNQVIYYDHWEDGLEADIFNPVQLSTLIIGDGNPANGDDCDFNNDPCGTDVLLLGDFANFASDQGLNAGCTIASAEPATFTELCSSVPVNPRCATPGACTAAEVHFDGGDLIVTSGGPLSIIHSEYPLTQFIGGSTEMLPRQAVAAATSYSVPVGEDLYTAFGCPDCVMEPFHYVDLNLVAFDDNTQVVVDSPGAGVLSFTLNRGEHWSSLGFIDDGPFIPTQFLTINSGTKVSTTGPVAGLIFTGGDGTWATRHYALLPDLLHSTDYVITAPGDDPAGGPSAPTDRPMNIYLFNPDPISAINITTTDTIGTSVVNVPPNSVVDYFSGTGRFVPNGSTVRINSNRNFWGVSAYDYNTNISDWGHSWLATRFLTDSYTVSFAPGNVDPTVNMVNLNGIFIAATQDNTQVRLDLDNDGDFDEVDTDGDGVADAGAPDPMCDAATPNCAYTVNSLASLRVFDPNDFDNTGTRIVANKPVAVAWGQDTDLTGFGDVALDTGFTVYPTNQLFLDPVLTLDKTVDMPVIATTGGVVTYTLTVSSYDFGPITNLQVYDLLPPAVPETAYVPGSTLITYPDLTQDTADPALSAGRLDWTLSPSTLQTNQTLTVRYSVNIPAAPGGTPRVLTNEAHAQGNLGGSLFSPFDTADVTQSDLLLTKAVDDVAPEAGDVLTYTLSLTNNGVAPETGATLTDVIPADTIFCDATTLPLGTCNDPTGPVVGTFDFGQNAVVWSLPMVPVGGPQIFTFQVLVNPGASAGSVITNSAVYESAQTPFISNEVESVVVGPDLVVSKIGPSLLHPNEIASFDILVQNTGAGSANNVRIIDPFPANVTYLAESMEWRLNVAPFTPVTDAADADEGTAFVDRLELLIATLGPGQDLTFRFFFRVNMGTVGLFVNNQATVSSTETPPRDTNLVQVPIVGSSDVTGHVFLDDNGDGVQQPGEPDLPNVDVCVTSIPPTRYTCLPSAGISDDGYDGSLGSMTCCTITVPIGDFGPTPMTTDVDLEIALTGHTNIGDLTIKVLDPLSSLLTALNRPGSGAADNGANTPAGDSSDWTGATISFDDDGGGPSAEALGSTIGGGVAVCTGDGICSYVPAPDTATGLANLAGFDGADPRGDWTVCVGDSAPGNVGTFVSASVLLTSTDSPSVTQKVATDANGDWIVTVNGTTATADVDETDPDFPPGAALTTANDPQSVTTVPSGTVATAPVGYQPQPVSFTKDSDPVGHEVFEGETITYTIEAVNTTAVTQTGIDLDDILPAGTTWVPGSTLVSQPVFRVDEYFVVATDFTGNTFDLTLNQNLVADYFAMVQGSDGNGAANGDRGPDENYASLTADPFGTGELATSSGADVLTLTRGNSVDGWQGVVTVVECLRDCAAGGFQLLDARRVDHAGATTSGAEATSNPWADINQTMLLGGFNGAGCDTTQAPSANTKVCHARIFPSGPDQINWTRDAGGATLSAATSTVMVVEWGNAWNVQRVRVQGGNGGGGADAVGEYNTAAIGPVARAATWVWGTGHTNDQGIGDAAEGVLLALGDGVNQNATESLVAAGLENAGNAVDFEVYALTHGDLATDQVFKADGDAGVLTFDVVTAAAGQERMAFSTNGQNGTGNAFPRPMFSARYTSGTTIRLERRRSGQAFPAWVQGIDFSAITIPAAPASGGMPPSLVVPADGFTIEPGATFSVTFQVVVDDPLAPGITQITNNATLNTDQQGPFNDSVVDDVIRLGVTVEPNNGNFVVFDALNPQTRTYGHVVTNTGQADDSYEITAFSELGFANPTDGWIVELIDPGTGTVIATDTDFTDSTWDGAQTVNTGTLMSGEMIAYDVRITVPAGTPEGTDETTTLTATSDRNTATQAFATDETTVVDMAGPVVLVSDQSGIVAAGGSIAYPHRIVNNTGVADTFDLSAFPSEPGWTSTIYNDSNGDGVYTPGIDVAIMNTLLLADGASQLFFVLVEAPIGAMDGDTDVTSITAISRNDTDLFDAVSDTTTINAASTHDLSGGDTLLVAPGDDCAVGNDCPVFPGTLRSLSASDDRFDFTITASPFFGLDGLPHATRLVIDTDADGVPDTQIAEDVDGDGTWDTIAPGFDTNMDSNPDVFVAALGELAYELRRPVDPLQQSYRDPVTLSAISQATGEVDSVTAVNIVVGFTHAMLAGFEVYFVGELVVEWRTSFEHGTAGFRLERRDVALGAASPGDGEFRPLHPGLLPALRDAALGGTYRFVDSSATADTVATYRLIEVEVSGHERLLGWTTTHLDVDQLTAAGSPAAGNKVVPAGGFSREPRAPSLARVAGSSPEPSAVSLGARVPGIEKGTGPPRLKLLVEDTGLYFADSASLADAFDVPVSEVEGWIAASTLILHGGRGVALPVEPCPGGPPDSGEIFSDGFESGDLCAWSSFTSDQPPGDAIPYFAAAGGLYFYGQAIDSIYTDTNVYWLERGLGAQMAQVAGGSPTPVTGLDFFENLQLEEEGPYPLTSVIEDPDSDFWFWDFVNVTPGIGVEIDTMSVTVDVPGPTATGGNASMTLHLQAETSDDDIAQDHEAEVRLGGTVLGSATWDGSTAYQLGLIFPQALLADGANTIEIHAPATSGIDSEIFYLDAIDLRYQRRYEAVGDQLTAAADGHAVLTFEGFTTGDVVVFEITDPAAPSQVTDTRIDAVGGTFQVSFETSSPSARYLALSLAGAAAAAIEVDSPSSLTEAESRADYLVIVAAGMEAAAGDLASHRQGQGLETMTVRLQDVYDEFNLGVVSPWAIRDFLTFAQAHWAVAPSYVVLAGDSSFDFKDRLGFGGNLLPSPMINTPRGLFPSDHRLADLVGGDGVPEVAIGRLPVRGDAQLAAYLAKLQAAEGATGAWKNRTRWVADAADEGGEFANDSDELISHVPPTLDVDRIYVDDLGGAAARQQLLDAIDDGSLFIHFLGHANLMQLGDDGGLLLASDVAALANGDRQPVLTALTCALGRFDRIVFDTLSERLLLHETGGVVGLWSPTGFALNQDGIVLSDSFLPVALGGGRLGDAVLAALSGYLANAEEPQGFVPFIYTLLGDPAIRLSP